MHRFKIQSSKCRLFFFSFFLFSFPLLHSCHVKSLLTGSICSNQRFSSHGLLCLSICFILLVAVKDISSILGVKCARIILYLFQTCILIRSLIPQLLLFPVTWYCVISSSIVFLANPRSCLERYRHVEVDVEVCCTR